MTSEHMTLNDPHFPEVLAPVGDFERLTYAVNYGADAVYLGGTAFGMRAASAKFDFDTMKKAVEYAHARDVKVYLTCNTLPLNSEVEQLAGELRRVLCLPQGWPSSFLMKPPPALRKKAGGGCLPTGIAG